MPSTPYYMRHFQIFDKIDSFLKDVSNVLDIFEKPLNLHIIVDKLFSPSVLDSRRTFCSIFHCRNSFNCKLEKLMNEQIIIYYSPSNALCLSGKSMQKNIGVILYLEYVLFPLGSICKYWISEAATRDVLYENVYLEISQNSQENTCARVSFLIKLQATGFIKKRLRHRCFPVGFAQILRTPFLQNTSNRLLLAFLLMQTHQIFNRSSNCVNVHYRKNQMFL